MKIFFQKVLRFPHFLYLLPFFFVFHGYVQDTAVVTLTDFVRLFSEYLLACGVLFFLGWLLFKKWHKAALFAFGLLFIHLFFGAFHDALKKVSPGFFLARYSILLPSIFGVLVLFLFFLKKTCSRFSKLFAYLNLLFLLLILIDVPSLFRQQAKASSTVQLQPCTTCDKPDVYLIIADEYADSASLAEIFKFNNSFFQAELRKRGFHISKSVSNYNFTPFAVASLLSMDYIESIEGRNSSYADRLKCAAIINQNVTWNFFIKSGYQLKNNSIYKINNQPTVVPQSHFRIGTDFIASHTLLSRIRQDLGYHLVTSLKIRSIIDEYTFHMDKTNKRLLQRLADDIAENGQKSSFVYTHIHMPHYPYYYRKDGTPNPEVVKPGNEFDKDSYIQYLQYSNTVYLNLIDKILEKSSRPPIILFMGDHGFREFRNSSPEEKKYYFMNLNAIYIPNGDYSRFYDGISGVNQFRALLNTAFGQNLPMLKDSTSFLEE